MRKVLSLIFGSRWLIPKSFLLIKKVIDDPRIVQICPDYSEVPPPKKKQQPLPQIKNYHFHTKGRLFGVPVSDSISDWWVAIYRLVDQEIALRIWWEAKKRTTTWGAGRDVLVESWWSDIERWLFIGKRGCFFSITTTFVGPLKVKGVLIEGFFQLVFTWFFLSSLNVLRSIPKVPEPPLKNTTTEVVNFRISMTSSWILDTKLLWYLYSYLYIFTNIKEWCKTSCLYMYIYRYMSYYQYHMYTCCEFEYVYELYISIVYISCVGHRASILFDSRRAILVTSLRRSRKISAAWPWIMESEQNNRHGAWYTPGGGFRYFVFSSLFGEMIQFDEYFSNGLVQPPPGTPPKN